MGNLFGEVEYFQVSAENTEWRESEVDLKPHDLEVQGISVQMP